MRQAQRGNAAQQDRRWTCVAPICATIGRWATKACVAHRANVNDTVTRLRPLIVVVADHGTPNGLDRIGDRLPRRFHKGFSTLLGYGG